MAKYEAILSAYAGLTAPTHLSPEQGRPLADADQTDRFGIVNLRFGDAPAIVFDFQHQPAVFLSHPDIDFGRIGVADDVGKSLLENTEESRIEILVPQRILNRGLDAALDAGLALELAGLPFDGRQQAGRIQYARAQFRRDAADGVHGLVDARSHGLCLFVQR